MTVNCATGITSPRYSPPLTGSSSGQEEIDRLRAARDRPGTPKDHANLVDAVSRRLTAVRSLLIR
jgi:hypothetical protein